MTLNEENAKELLDRYLYLMDGRSDRPPLQILIFQTVPTAVPVLQHKRVVLYIVSVSAGPRITNEYSQYTTSVYRLFLGGCSAFDGIRYGAGGRGGGQNTVMCAAGNGADGLVQYIEWDSGKKKQGSAHAIRTQSFDTRKRRVSCIVYIDAYTIILCRQLSIVVQLF